MSGSAGVSVCISQCLHLVKVSILTNRNVQSCDSSCYVHYSSINHVKTNLFFGEGGSVTFD